MSHEEPTPPATPPAYVQPTTSRPLTRDEPPPPEKTVFPLIASVAFAGVVVGSWLMQGSAAGVPTAPPVPASTTDADGGDAAPAPTPTPVAPAAPAITAETVKADLDALARKIDEMPKAEPAPAVDLKPIQEQIAALAKSVEPVAALPRSVEDLSAKLAASEKSVEALKAELTTAKDELTARIAAIPAAGAAPSAAPAVDAAAMTSALDLFKANKFAEALDAFKKLPATDARVLYYTALSNGLATKSWTGETERLALQGVEREKAGSPASAEIDAALAGLTEQQGKAWLAFFRAKAK